MIKPIETVEKEFVKFWEKENTNKGGLIYPNRTAENVLAFLKEKLSSQRTELLGVIESKIIPWKRGDRTMRQFERGYNQALDDIKNILNK